VSTSVAQQLENPPIYGVAFSMDHTSEVQHLEQVSTINTFMQSCVKLFNDPSSIKVLKYIIERCNTKVEGNL
jgi:hypothetical protein